MKTTDEIIRRPWLYPAYPWRAADKNGKFYYFKIKPTKAHSVWKARNYNYIHASSEAGQEHRTWAEQFWSISLQSFEDYQNLTNQQWPNQNQDQKSE